MVEAVHSEDTAQLGDIAMGTILDELRNATALDNPGIAMLRSALQLALLLSPIYLLLAFQIVKKSFHRRMVLEYAVKLGPHKPELLVKVEDLILDALFTLSRGKVTAHHVLQTLVENIPWAELETTSANGQRGWFASRTSKSSCMSCLPSILFISLSV